MRLLRVLPAVAASMLAALTTNAGAQESSARSTAIEAGVGVGTQVPGRGDEGLGPFVSATLRFASGRSGRAFLLGAGYAIVFTDGWTSIEGDHYDYAPEAIMLHLGHEWPLGEQRRVTIDAQWNPALSRVRRLGRRPPWPTESSTWDRTATTGSVGVRYILTGSRGPVVGVSLRTYLAVTPFLWIAGVHPSSVVGVTVRPR